MAKHFREYSLKEVYDLDRSLERHVEIRPSGEMVYKKGSRYFALMHKKTNSTESRRPMTA
jgi:hypothetical protein